LQGQGQVIFRSLAKIADSPPDFIPTDSKAAKVSAEERVLQQSLKYKRRNFHFQCGKKRADGSDAVSREDDRLIKRDDILNALGACGVQCSKCFAYEQGDIQSHSSELKRLLGCFDVYAERFVTLLNEPRFKNYAPFKDLLQLFSEAGCRGCRQGECLFKDCGIIRCYRGKGVDFCFECEDYPCDRTNFDEHLKTRWLQINDRMKEIGVERYYEEVKDVPRY